MRKPPPVGECDACGEMVPLFQLSELVAYGIDTTACCHCRGVEPEDEEDDDEEWDFSCGRCGGSGGGPEHWACPACFGSGFDRRAMQAARDEARADRDY